MKRGAWRHLIAAVLLAGLVMAACGSPADSVGPVERQQIQNVVKDYWTRNNDIPDYTADIDALTSSWARVSIHPAGVSSQGSVEFYLHKELGQGDVTPVPTAQTDVSVASEDPVTTSSGWTIVLGPKASFTAAELDAAGVPQAVRP